MFRNPRMFRFHWGRRTLKRVCPSWNPNRSSSDKKKKCTFCIKSCIIGSPDTHQFGNEIRIPINHNIVSTCVEEAAAASKQAS